MNRLKKIILQYKFLAKPILGIWHYINSLKVYVRTNKRLNNICKPGRTIFYLGIPTHRNLGDLAQGVCIRKWLHKHYPERQVVEIETDALVNTRFSLLYKLKERYQQGDIIVFQSGYTTTDLGGYADEMHRAVMCALPDADMIMMPQTIFFHKVENKKRTANCYNKIHHMLFLARDAVSYQRALEMFPDISVSLYPDIVTTLIGEKKYEYSRDGILFCCRNDSEKYYSDHELQLLMNQCSMLCKVERTDTTKNGNKADIINRADFFIRQEIDRYAHFKLIITDRYHGTILSLAAGTPVIVLKTTDHKVVTGADWFKKIYPGYIYVADSILDAFSIAQNVLTKKIDYQLEPYFEREYYDKLPELFREVINKR